MSYPLEGLKVLDMSRVLAGPLAGRLLSDLGADVVKIEPPDGDITRLWGAEIGGIAGYFNQQNVGKRDICIDMSVEGAAELVKALVKEADILVENFRPNVMARFGLDYTSLKAVNPRLIMLSISGFGANGPESLRAAYAPIIHAEIGLVARQSGLIDAPECESDKKYTDIAVPVADTNASLHGLVGLLSALYMRARTGLGQHIDLAMIDASLINDDQVQYALEDSGATRAMPPEIWDTATGPVIIAGDFRYIWRKLVDTCGVQDPTPPGAALDDKIRLRRAAAQKFIRELPDRETLIQSLGDMNLAWGDVRDIESIQNQPTVKHRGSIVEVDNKEGGTRPVVQSPYRFSDAESGIRGPAPARGEHNLAVLGDWLGFDEMEVQEHITSGVLVAPVENKDRV